MTAAASRQQGPTAPGILVADDDAAIRALLETGLRRRGFTVWSARDGREALDLYRQHADEITLVLLDVRMPVVDGAEALAQLRAQNPNLTAYVMSGHLGGYSEEELRRRGAAGVIEKPFSLPEVVDTLWRAAARLERRAFVRQHARPLRLRSRQGSEGLVKDCSRGGLGLLWDQPAPVRTVLDVRPADAPEAAPWVQVEVKHCQPQGSGYAIGCQFVSPTDTPPPFFPY